MDEYSETRSLADEIKTLRKSGKLQDAYGLAKRYRSQYPDDKDIESELSWVIYDCLKRYKGDNPHFAHNIDLFLKTLKLLPSFTLDPGDHGLFYDNIAIYLISAVAWDCKKSQNFQGFNKLADVLIELYTTTGSSVYQKMVTALSQPLTSWGWEYVKANDLKGLNAILAEAMHLSTYGKDEMYLTNPGFAFDKKDRPAGFRTFDMVLLFFKGYEPIKEAQESAEVLRLKAQKTVEFIEWFGLDRMGKDCFAKKVYNEKEQPSLAEKLVSRYIKILALKDQNGAFTFDAQTIDRGLAALEQLLKDERNAEWVWPRYQFGKLLLETKGPAVARPFVAEVLLQQWNNQNAWAAFAETYQDEDANAYSQCLFHALELAPKIASTNLSLHLRALRYFEQSGRYAEAKHEAVLISDYRRDQGWNPDPTVQRYENAPWYETAPTKDNIELYRALAQGAEHLLLPYGQREDFYVEWKDVDKELIGIVTKFDEKEKISESMAQFGVVANCGWSNRIQRVKIHDGDLARQLECLRCYSAVMTPNRRVIIGEVEDCTDQEFIDRFICDFQGTFEKVKEFGFIRETARGSLFVPPSLVSDLHLETYDVVTGQAVASYRRKDKEKTGTWEMKVVSISIDHKMPVEECEKEFEGYLEETRWGLSFINGCFVPDKLAWEIDYDYRDKIKLRARKTWDRKKCQWGWTAVEILSGMREY